MVICVNTLFFLSVYTILICCSTIHENHCKVMDLINNKKKI